MSNANRQAQSAHTLLYLDLLRFIAACAIVLHHSWAFLFPVGARAAWYDRTQGMAFFVDVFFAISGFVIATVYSTRINSPSDYLRYMQRRIARLLPLHWATLALSVAIFGAVSAAGLKMNTQVHFNPGCVLSTMLFAHTFTGCAPGEVYNPVNWSLSAEMAMYLIFPLLLVPSLRWPKATVVAAAAIFAGLVGYVSTRDGLLFRQSSWQELFPALRALPAFLFGIGLFVSRSTLPRLPNPAALTWGLLAGLMVAILAGAPGVIELVLAYALVLTCVAADMRGDAGQLVRRAAPLGELTYSIYLLHPSIILVLANGIGDKALKLSTAPMALLLVFTYALLFFCAKVSLRYFERPTRAYLGALGESKPAEQVRVTPESTGCSWTTSKSARSAQRPS